MGEAVSLVARRSILPRPDDRARVECVPARTGYAAGPSRDARLAEFAAPRHRPLPGLVRTGAERLARRFATHRVPPVRRSRPTTRAPRARPVLERWVSTDSVH